MTVIDGTSGIHMGSFLEYMKFLLLNQNINLNSLQLSCICVTLHIDCTNDHQRWYKIQRVWEQKQRTYIIDVKLKIPCKIIWHWGWFRRTNVLGGCNLPSGSIVHWNWTWHLYCIGQWSWLTSFEVILPINFYGLLCATDDLFVHLIQPLSHEAILMLWVLRGDLKWFTWG